MKMKSILLGVVLWLFVIQLYAENSKTIKVYNYTDSIINYLYVASDSGRSSEYWGESYLYNGIEVNDDYELTIPFDGNDYISIMAENENSRMYIINAFPVSTIDEIYIREKNYYPPGGENPVEVELEIVNQTGEEIYSIFISLEESAYWGEDILEDETLSDGESFFTTLIADKEYPYFDLYIEGISGNAYYVQKRDILNDSIIYVTDELITSYEDSYDDYYDDDYVDDYDSYREGYREGYQDGYGQGYQDGLERSAEYQ